MSPISNDPLTQVAFSIHENPGVYGLLLGSGLSRAAEIPTGWEITIDLIRRVAGAEGIPHQDDWGRWYRDRTGSDPDYSVLLEELGSTPDERRSIIDGYIEPTPEDREEGRKLPTQAHRAIAALVRNGHIRRLITTNFDRLLETALRDEGVEPTVVSSVDALKGAPPYVHTQCFLLKLHGDYKDARLLNTDSELREYPPEYEQLLDRLLDEHGLLVTGWSGEWDAALRNALLRTPNRRFPIFWTTRSQPAELAREIINHRSASVLQIEDADRFFTTLAERINTLEETRAHRPESATLLVQTVKRYLARPEYKIKLDDFVDEQTTLLVGECNDDELAAQGQFSQEEFVCRVNRYDAATEHLGLVVGAMGRWGTGEDLDLVVSAIAKLVKQAHAKRGGLVVWMDLRYYPSALIGMSYALGLVRSRRFADLHKLLRAQVQDEHGQKERLLHYVFPPAYLEPKLRDVWNHAMEENKTTPVSDWVYSIVSSWGDLFLGLTPDVEELYHRLEVLGSLVSLDDESESALESGCGQKTHEPFVWMPLGRVGWHTSEIEHLLTELADDNNLANVVGAGFGGGSQRCLELGIENLRRMAGRLRFW